MDNMPINTRVKSFNPLSPAIGTGDKKKLDRKKLKKACTDFEALFIAQMLKSMRQTVPQTGFLGKGLGNEIYQGLMDQELSKKLAHNKGLGLGQVLYRQMLRQEEKIPLVSKRGQPLKPFTQSRPEVEKNR
jgi:flagellar protein FlgJ